MLVKSLASTKASSPKTPLPRPVSSASNTQTPLSKSTKPIKSPIASPSKIQSSIKNHPLKLSSPLVRSRNDSPFSNTSPKNFSQIRETLASETGSTNQISDSLITPGGSYRKLVEEITALKKELDQKNNTINKLTKENEGLHRDLEEFLSTVEDARKLIDSELKDCNKRIQELETEIQELRSENRTYRDQLSQKKLYPKGILKDKQSIRAETEGCIDRVRNDMETFYFELNEEIIGLVDSSKKQFNELVRDKVQGSKEELIGKLGDGKGGLHGALRSVSMSMGNSPLNTKKSSGQISFEDHVKGRKQSVTFALDNSMETQSTLNRSHDKKKAVNYSVSYIDTEPKINTAVYVNGGGSEPKRLSNNSRESPKPSLLRTRLKSDKILQEMKKRLVEGNTGK